MPTETNCSICGQNDGAVQIPTELADAGYTVAPMCEPCTDEAFDTVHSAS